MKDCRKRIWIVSLAVLRRFIGTTVEMVCPPFELVADDRCNDDHHGFGLVGSFIQGQSARLLRFSIRSVCRCLAPYHWC
jgi:hypothetical protein